MKRASFIALLAAMVGALLCACSGAPDETGSASAAVTGVQGEQLPTAGNGITDVGSPVEEPDVPAGGGNDCSYANTSHGIFFICPAGWRMIDFDEAHVQLVSDAGVDLDFSFIDLAAGETLQSFLDQARGGSEGLHPVEKPGFSEALCAPEASVDDETGLFTVECYHAGQHEGLRFVLVEAGVVDRVFDLKPVGQEFFRLATPESLVRSNGTLSVVEPVRNGLNLRRRVFPK